MHGPGDVWTARARYFDRPSANLRLLVRNRYEWMNRFVPPEGRGVEFGSGAGFSREFIRSRELLLTDFADYEWLDRKYVDALHAPFEDESFDFVVSVNVIHHLAHPLRFFSEAHRILKPGGLFLIQDVHCSVFLRAALRLQRHEGYDYNVNVFDENAPCTDPDNPWEGNNAIVDLLLEDEEKFAAKVPFFRRVYRGHSEFLTFLNSGGVIAKTAYVPLPTSIMRVVDALDRALTNTFPAALACQVQLVFERR